jgi:hypothetical protein
VGDSLEHVADAAHALDLLLAEVAHAGRVAHTLMAHARTRIIRVCVFVFMSVAHAERVAHTPGAQTWHTHNACTCTIKKEEHTH